MQKAPELKIGTRIDIVFENEINTSNAHYMKALIYDIEGGKITISQTTPALNRNFLNRRVLITFLASTEKRVLRFGVRAMLTDLIVNYQISSDKNVEALILKKNAQAEPIDFRMHFRVKLPSQSDISLFIKEEKINLIDISLGGARFTCPKSYPFRYGDPVKLKLVIGSKEFAFEARVRNVLQPQEYSSNKTIQYIGVEFDHDNKQMEALLGKAIMDIERQLLSEGKMT